MAELTELRFETGKGERVLVLDQEAIRLLENALTQIGRRPGQSIRERKQERDAILAGQKSVPPMLYNRFHKMMQKRLGESPVRLSQEQIGAMGIAPIRPVLAPGVSGPVRHRVEEAEATDVGGARLPSAAGRGRATGGRAASMPIGDQIKIKRRRKEKDAQEGRIYRDFIPVTIGATIGRAKGDPTSNIFAVGKHRGTIYIVEEISAPVPLPAARHMPKTVAGRKRAQAGALAPYQWQARVLSHPWTRMGRGGFAQRGRGTGGATSGLEGLHKTGDLVTHEFPVYEGKDGWKEAKTDVERAINNSYSFRVVKGDIPPELKRHVKDEMKKVREGGKTPSLAPIVRKKKNPKKKSKSNPKVRTRVKAAVSTTATVSKRRIAASKKPTKKRASKKKNPSLLEEWKEKRAAAKEAEAAIKSKLRAEAAVSRAAAKEAERAEKDAEKARDRAGLRAERDRKTAAGEKYRAEQVAEHGELYGTPAYTVGRGLGKLAEGSRKATARFAKMFTKPEEKKLSAAVRGQRSVFTNIGKKHINKFEASFKKWDSSVKKKQPEFAQLLDSYDNLLFAHAYLTLGGGDGRTARALDQIRDSLLAFLRCVDPQKAELLTQTVMKGARKLSGFPNSNPKNPTSEVHQEMGEGFLSESEKLWASYCKTRSPNTLLDAYRTLELACQEFEYTGDKKRMRQAKEGIKAARAELLSGMRAPAAKKKATKKRRKKATKKKAK